MRESPQPTNELKGEIVMAIQEMERTEKFETYHVLSMTMSMSGHYRYHSAFETDDTCGNCDGGRCDNCRPIYEVIFEVLLPSTVTGEFFDELKPVVHRYFEDQSEALCFYNDLKRVWFTKKEEPCE